MKKTIALSAISAMALTGFAYSEIETDFHVGYNSTYVWRGQDRGDSMYEYGLDVAGSCDCGLDWSAGIWYANPSDNEFNDELRIFGEVSKDFGSFTAALGFIHYEFDDTADADNTEAYVSVGTSYMGIDLGATYFQVIDGDTGTNPSWGELNASYTHEYSDTLGLTLGVSYGFTIDADGGDSYSALGARLSADFAASEDITISPYVAYNGTDNFSGAGGMESFEGLYGGILVGFSF